MSASPARRLAGGETMHYDNPVCIRGKYDGCVDRNGVRPSPA